MHQGTVCNLQLARGFGFIAEPGSPDLFFHAKSLAPDILFDEKLMGRRVEFEVTQNERGPRAESVRGVE